MLLRWQFMFSLQEPTLTMMHEQVRGVLLDLFLLDNRFALRTISLASPAICQHITLLKIVRLLAS